MKKIIFAIFSCLILGCGVSQKEVDQYVELNDFNSLFEIIYLKGKFRGSKNATLSDTDRSDLKLAIAGINSIAEKHSSISLDDSVKNLSEKLSQWENSELTGIVYRNFNNSIRLLNCQKVHENSSAFGRRFFVEASVEEIIECARAEGIEQSSHVTEWLLGDDSSMDSDIKQKISKLERHVQKAHREMLYYVLLSDLDIAKKINWLKDRKRSKDDQILLEGLVRLYTKKLNLIKGLTFFDASYLENPIAIYQHYYASIENDQNMHSKKNHEKFAFSSKAGALQQIDTAFLITEETLMMTAPLKEFYDSEQEKALRKLKNVMHLIQTEKNALLTNKAIKHSAKILSKRNSFFFFQANLVDIAINHAKFLGRQGDVEKFTKYKSYYDENMDSTLESEAMSMESVAMSDAAIEEMYRPKSSKLDPYILKSLVDGYEREIEFLNSSLKNSGSSQEYEILERIKSQTEYLKDETLSQLDNLSEN
ncbi:hypothetical protein [Microbulbifer sp. YPW1]|uniref:hypothetical protein n=1 Tax=Microbulbifer sp. YPW1 TaxID=2745199 RepID=UPI00159AA626|nr:hypothetical protein [Microbulbifer sp. YPW1]QKX16245.1 hypothetical protein HUW35_04190 [Microbulbifer sp. YPW1]